MSPLRGLTGKALTYPGLRFASPGAILCGSFGAESVFGLFRRGDPYGRPGGHKTRPYKLNVNSIRVIIATPLALRILRLVFVGPTR